ncbi:MAG: biosynthetic arginine decarboxylase [Gammaproteobacteria bacterium]|nr:biosynthetic arginine decarboxylase [Gammaproteobacteria bacterium]
MTDWNIEKARKIYNLTHWSGGYFDINEQGHLCAYPDGDHSKPGIDLYELSNNFHELELKLPVLVRFNDILHDRIDRLCEAFDNAIAQNQYQGSYQPVYPIKVNQQQSVVSEIIKHGQARVGLEAGSKPELLAVMAMSYQDGSVIVCNGYKDREYVRLALIGLQLGLQVYIVIEKVSELELVIEEAQSMGVTPLLGIRTRLASIGAGKWQNTGGEKSKFGVTAAQLLQCVNRLQELNMSQCLQMLHCHLGSQIANISDIQRGLRECARTYAELHNLNIPIKIVDVGGGLGIDYEGTRSRSFCSVNYSLQEYANNVVHTFWEICQEQDLTHPNIFTESGRALTAHHAMLITNVIETGQNNEPQAMLPPDESAEIILHDLWKDYQLLIESKTDRAAVEIYHDAIHAISQVHSMYSHGVLDLSQRAKAEELYYAICWHLKNTLTPDSRSHREVLDDLHDRLAEKYFCNLSIFQSLPDVWAIEQIFPITPLHRLEQEPENRGVIEDITCDSDGRIDHYVDNEGIESSLPLHQIKPGEKYLLGIFLVGAYQEILGDMHNLFGDTDAVNISLNEQGGYQFSQPMPGDSVADVLNYVRFDSNELLQLYKNKIDRKNLPSELQQQYLQELEDGLNGYTYLEE